MDSKFVQGTLFFGNVCNRFTFFDFLGCADFALVSSSSELLAELILGAWVLVVGTWVLVVGAWELELGALELVVGALELVVGALELVVGALGLVVGALGLEHSSMASLII